MPTSSGKTKSIELIIRSAFLSDRTSLAVVVAPFRSLCYEIKTDLTKAFRGEEIEIDDLSEVMQMDLSGASPTVSSDINVDTAISEEYRRMFDEALASFFSAFEVKSYKQILVVTPEKLLYVLKHEPRISSIINLVIFDEGHQFDSGTRGITYELLLSSLRLMLPETAQKVLISAVINNSSAVAQWLNNNDNIIESEMLPPTFRSIGFVSWMEQLGKVQYLDSTTFSESEGYYVPRVIEAIALDKRGQETKKRYFPEKGSGQSVALYLGLKLVPNGSVAIFCGDKRTAPAICDIVNDLVTRNAHLTFPDAYSNSDEIARLINLHRENLGNNCATSVSASKGIFVHTGTTPRGIRLAIEHAMREDLIRFVVCTSTLAQGVNLPLRYLIVTSMYQAGEKIKTRDFQNLIGRAGRAGMHTEGNILFANPDFYDGYKYQRNSWRWNEAKQLLNISNSEPCISNLLSIFEPLKSEDEQYSIQMDPLEYLRDYISNPDAVLRMAEQIAVDHGQKNFTKENIIKQIDWKKHLISAVESFLLSHWDENEEELTEEKVIKLAESTLAFFLANEKQKEQIRAFFKLLYAYISGQLPDPAKRRCYGRTMYGVKQTQLIERWVSENLGSLISLENEEQAFDLIWPEMLSNLLIKISIQNDDGDDIYKNIGVSWLKGASYYEGNL